MGEQLLRQAMYSAGYHLLFPAALITASQPQPELQLDWLFGAMDESW